MDVCWSPCRVSVGGSVCQAMESAALREFQSAYLELR